LISNLKSYMSESDIIALMLASRSSVKWCAPTLAMPWRTADANESQTLTRKINIVPDLHNEQRQVGATAMAMEVSGDVDLYILALAHAEPTVVTSSHRCEIGAMLTYFSRALLVSASVDFERPRGASV
jgi:hypothetical protein